MEGAPTLSSDHWHNGCFCGANAMSMIVVREGESQRLTRVRNVYCIGRNYAAHIAELGNRPAESPVVFIKPSSALNTGPLIGLPSHSSDVHYETELVLLVGQGGKNIPEERALAHIQALGLGLDLTARDLQEQAKKAGLPWAVAKGFDDSATLTDFIPASCVSDWGQLEFQMHLNGQLRQHGHVDNMIYSLSTIISYLSRVFTLLDGDIIYTGTPEGVGSLNAGDVLRLQLLDWVDAEFRVKHPA
jgi:2-keto-4-pentenoate hydratase/2-oxohepta-3-ene-1,7-dioic acid hydratase in catechol pathway